ncbi:MAG: hypothetical protein ACI9J2_000131 [Saprospiraceae bacterium]|jgi:hypothetical protein
MLQILRNKVGSKIIGWLTKSLDAYDEGLIDFDRMKDEILPGDVLLVEGQSQVSRIIQTITQSRWSHSAICVGRPADFLAHLPTKLNLEKFTESANAPFVVEAELGKGTILEDIEQYRNFRVRICRPNGLSHNDRNQVVEYVCKRLGAEYNVRQLLDLARFLFPYGILPRRWRSSLFEHNAGPETKIVCSTLIADAFQDVNFPILPILSPNNEGHRRLFKRNAKLFSPSDFDISPFFTIVKFPKYTWNERRYYHHLPWAKGDKGYPDNPNIAPEYQRSNDQQTKVDV